MNRRLLVGVASLMLAACDSSGDPAAAKRTVHLGEENYEAFVGTPAKVAVVMFHADWCAPCKEMGSVVDKVTGEFSNATLFGKVDVDAEPELAGRLGVGEIPEVRLYRGGVMVDAVSGSLSRKEFRERVVIQVDQMEP